MFSLLLLLLSLLSIHTFRYFVNLPSPLLLLHPPHFCPLLWALPLLHPPSAVAPPTSCSLPPHNRCSKSVSSLHTITSESTQCTCSHSTTNLASTNHPDRNERARSLGAEQRFQVTRNGNGTQTQAQAQTKPSPKGSPKMQQRSRRGSWLFGRKQQQR